MSGLRYRLVLCGLVLFMLAGFGLLYAGIANATPVIGANAEQLFLNWQRGVYTLDQVNTELSRIRASGVTSVRVSAPWPLSEPTRDGSYDWSYNDTVAYLLKAHDLRWMALVTDAPGWATDKGVTTGPEQWNFGGQIKTITVHYPPQPEYYRYYAGYAAAFARRYHPASLEVWNEPNIMAYWWPRGSSSVAQDWRTLFDDTYSAVKAASPSTQVLGPVLGGLNGEPFFHAVAPGLHTDGVAFHYYGPTVADNIAVFTREALEIKALVHAPMYANEYGWRLHVPGVNVPESLFGQQLRGFANMPNLAESDWFTWMISGAFGMDSTNDAYWSAAVRAAKIPWYTVPSLHGDKLLRARRALRNDHFKVGKIHRVKHHGKAGRVLRTNPVVGWMGPAGTSVDLWVARG